ncbi:hypothetical protein SprV_0401712600 [Sparganum proliferum]
MEKIIKKALMQFLEQHHLLSDAQHGFRSGRSCPTNLLFTLERWTKARDEGNVEHAIYIDFKKAFDSVPHQRLLHKLRNAGIHGRLLVWIQSFLAGRASTVLGGSHSLEVRTVYRPLKSDPEADARLLEELGRFALRPDVLIMGDFNAPLIDWNSLYTRGPELAFDRRLVDKAVWSFLTQHVLFPTMNAEILGRGNDRITRETIEAWHTGANSINRSVALPEAYQALRTQRSEQKSRVRLRQDRNPSTTESMGDTRAAVLQPESDEGAMFTTAASYTYLAGVRTNDRSNANGPDEGAIITATHAEAYKLQSSEVSVVSRRGSDRIARETIEAWHTGTTSINPCVALPAAYQALPAQLSKQMSRREPRLNMNPDMSESMADAHSVTPQPGSDEGAVVTTVVPSTSVADEKTDSRCGVNKIVSLGRQLRSTKVRTTTTNVSTPVPDVD